MNLTLQHGDKVALIAPASGQKSGNDYLVEQAIEQLESWGLDVVITPELSEPQRYLSASDRVRAEQLRYALTHPEVRAIFVTRGGYGAARLLSSLSDIIVPSERFLVGFSDITTLHLHFMNTPNVRSVHGVNVATESFLADSDAAADNRIALYQALFANDFPSLQLKPLYAERSQVAFKNQTAYTGGCLSLLVTSLGTPHEIDTTDKVLLIEEVGESPYKIDRMLTHLNNAGKFERIKALVFGQLVGCNMPNIAIEDVLAEWFIDADFPVFLSDEFGHGAINLPWRYH